MSAILESRVRNDASLLTVPCLIGRKPFKSIQDRIVFAYGQPAAKLCVAPRLIQSKMIRAAEAAFAVLRGIADDDLYESFERAAEFFANPPAEVELEPLDEHCARVVELTGLTASAVRYSLSELCTLLSQMRRVVRAQSPTGDESIYRTWELLPGVGFTPNGKTVAVRIPDNSPSSINVCWLMTLAMRRPVLLLAEDRLAHTVHRLATCLYAAGIPEGSISIGNVAADAFWEKADQIIWPGKIPPGMFGSGRSIHTYHLGRSKALLLGGVAAEGEWWRRLAGMAKHNCGRVCTKLTAVITDGDASADAAALAAAIAKYDIFDLWTDGAVNPAFPDPALATQLCSAIDQAVQRGAVDHTATWFGNLPLSFARGGRIFMRPTVLEIDLKDPLFGAELPFPFLTVAAAPLEEMALACSNSLIVNVIGEAPSVLTQLLVDPSISKILVNEDIGRHYDAAQPHEGFLSDFLFAKKTVTSEVLNDL